MRKRCDKEGKVKDSNLKKSMERGIKKLQERVRRKKLLLGQQAKVRSCASIHLTVTLNRVRSM